jgi:hypothetical protein
VVCNACPEPTEITVLGDGSLTRLVLPAGLAEWPSEVSQMTEGEGLALPARYASGRREAWLHQHGTELGYHNHWWEFERGPDGKVAY